jgi:hypothetical protein
MPYAVAVGACYARNVYRHQGIRRVAIVDFDVHHGSGVCVCVCVCVRVCVCYVRVCVWAPVVAARRGVCVRVHVHRDSDVGNVRGARVVSCRAGV